MGHIYIGLITCFDGLLPTSDKIHERQINALNLNLKLEELRIIIS
jgi:hypothetical protein